MYDKKYWRQGKNVTVGQLMDYIRKNVPEDAVFCVLGNNLIYFHLEEDKSVFCVDDAPLSELEEYAGFEPMDI